MLLAPTAPDPAGVATLAMLRTMVHGLDAQLVALTSARASAGLDARAVAALDAQLRALREERVELGLALAGGLGGWGA